MCALHLLLSFVFLRASGGKPLVGSDNSGKSLFELFECLDYAHTRRLVA